MGHTICILSRSTVSGDHLFKQFLVVRAFVEDARGRTIRGGPMQIELTVPNAVRGGYYKTIGTTQQSTRLGYTIELHNTTQHIKPNENTRACRVRVRKSKHCQTKHRNHTNKGIQPRGAHTAAQVHRTARLVRSATSRCGSRRRRSCARRRFRFGVRPA